MIAPASSPALLIALIGSPGPGRTALLAQLAAEFRRTGRRVEGALAIAERRDGPEAGAGRCHLHLLGEPEERLGAGRCVELPADATAPDPRLDDEPHRRLRVWAEGLRRQPPADLLVLDDFGQLETQDDALSPLASALAASAPRIAVLGVREHLVAATEARLGRSFDLRISADAPDAAGRLHQACADFGEWTQIGLWGGVAGGIEMSAGALLHATVVPLRGMTLSSTQAAVMTFASAGLSQPGRVLWVPLISAGLKAFSAGGGRIRPMLAISVQGTLFTACVQLLGRNAASLALGGALIGAWAALQGFLVQYLLLGEDLVRAYERLVRWLAGQWQITAPSMPALLAAWALLHAVAAASAALAAWRLRQPPRALRRVMDQELAALAPPPAKPLPRFRRILRELGRWQLWLPLVLVAAVLLATGRDWEHVLWLALRFGTLALVLLSVLSLFQPAWLAERLRRRGWWGPAAAFHGAFRRRMPLP